MSNAPWFRVSVSASRSFLANAAPLCQGLAKYAGFDQREAPEVGALLLEALRKAIGGGRNAAEPLIDIVCRMNDGRFEARVTREGQAVETVVRPVTRAV